MIRATVPWTGQSFCVSKSQCKWKISSCISEEPTISSKYLGALLTLTSIVSNFSTSWDCTDTENQHKRVPWRESLFYHQIWNFKRGFKKGKNTLQPGNHEFYFSVSLNSRLPPTIEGLDDCFIRYKLTAELNCPWGVINKSRSMNVSRMQDTFSFMEPQVSGHLLGF